MKQYLANIQKLNRRNIPLYMSVPSWNRNESKVLYLDVARELIVFTGKCLRKFPKAATFYFSIPIMDSARNIYKYCATANNRFPKSIEDYQFRKNYLVMALGELDAIDLNISLAIDAYSISTKGNEEKCKIDCSEYAWAYWGELIYKERNLIHKVIESDNSKLNDIK